MPRLWTMIRSALPLPAGGHFACIYAVRGLSCRCRLIVGLRCFLLVLIVVVWQLTVCRRAQTAVVFAGAVTGFPGAIAGFPGAVSSGLAMVAAHGLTVPAVEVNIGRHPAVVWLRAGVVTLASGRAGSPLKTMDVSRKGNSVMV